MPELKVSVLVELDGVPMPGFPYVERCVVEQVAPWNPFLQPAAAPGTFSTVPATHIALLQALIVRPDRLVTLRIDGQTDSGIEITAGGLFLLLGGQANAGPTLNATLHAAAETAIRGLAAGAAA